MLSAKELVDVINQTGLSLSSGTWILLLLFSLTSSLLGALIVSYAKEKGKNYATREDFGDIQAQLISNTEVVEKLKDNIAKSSAIEQKRWEYKLKHYVGIIHALENFSRMIHRLYITMDMVEKKYADADDAKKEIEDLDQLDPDSIESFHRHAVSIKIFCNKDIKKEIEALQDDVHKIGEALYEQKNSTILDLLKNSIKKINDLIEKLIYVVKKDLFTD